MKKNQDLKKIEWYDNGYVITTFIIISILLIVLCSQSFIVGDSGGSLALLGSIINHNSIYLLVLCYFILLKFPIGKKYFNYLNIFLVFIYLIATITSFLTVIQAFSLNIVLTFTLNFIFVIYLSHTLFRDTRLWKEFHLGESPFNELTNEWLFYAIIVVSSFLLAVNLISTVVVRGVLLSFLECFYFILLGRYIYLYRDYLDSKRIDSENHGNFKDLQEKVHEIINESKIDEKIDDVTDKVIDTTKSFKEKVDSFVDEKELDKKIDDAVNHVKKSVDSFIEKNDVKKNIKNDKDKVEESFSKIESTSFSYVDSADKEKKKTHNKKKYNSNKKNGEYIKKNDYKKGEK